MEISVPKSQATNSDTTEGAEGEQEEGGDGDIAGVEGEVGYFTQP